MYGNVSAAEKSNLIYNVEDSIDAVCLSIQAMYRASSLFQ